MPPEPDDQNEETTEEPDDRLEGLIAGLETRIVDRLIQTIEPKLESRFDSVADRRVNAILKEVRKGQGGEGAPPPTEPQANGGNDRMRRATLKSAIQSELVMRDLTIDEKRMAQEMAFQLAENRSLGDSDDEFAIATQIVDGAVRTLHGARDTYQEQLRDELKSRGVSLDDEEKPQPGRKPRAKANNDSQNFDKGAERAKALGLA